METRRPRPEMREEQRESRIEKMRKVVHDFSDTPSFGLLSTISTYFKAKMAYEPKDKFPVGKDEKKMLAEYTRGHLQQHREDIKRLIQEEHDIAKQMAEYIITFVDNRDHILMWIAKSERSVGNEKEAQETIKLVQNEQTRRRFFEESPERNPISGVVPSKARDLAKAGRFIEAKQAAQEETQDIQHEERRQGELKWRYETIAAAQAAHGHMKEARETAQEVDSEGKLEPFFIGMQAQHGDIEGAKALTRKKRPDWRAQAECYEQIVRVEANAGKIEDAKKTMQKIRSTKKTNNEHIRNEAKVHIVKALLYNADTKSAIELVDTVTERKIKDHLLKEIIESELLLGKTDVAQNLTSSLSSAGERDDVLHLIMKTQIRIGDIAGAKESIEQLRFSTDRKIALLYLCLKTGEEFPGFEDDVGRTSALHDFIWDNQLTDVTNIKKFVLDNENN